MGRLPHRIFKGLQAVAEGLPRYRSMEQLFNEMAKWQNTGPDWKERARREGIKIFSDLRRQGFIVEKGDGIFLTKRGREKLKLIAKKFLKITPRKKYASEKSKDLIIISFDIPEHFRGKRDWLRSVLKNLGLKLYHQSLWMGKIAIPEEFIKDLTAQQLDSYVAIFTVGKQGTLKKLFN